MIVDVEDVRRLIKDALDRHDRIHAAFSEAQEIALREIIRDEIQKLDQQGFFNHDHEEGEQKPYLAREEDAKGV
jgi:hypothetical protein